MGREWELSYRPRHAALDLCRLQRPCGGLLGFVFLIYPFGQGSFSDGMPLGISAPSTFMLVFQSEHNI